MRATETSAGSWALAAHLPRRRRALEAGRRSSYGLALRRYCLNR